LLASSEKARGGTVVTVLPEWAFGRIAPELELRGLQPLPISLPHPNDLDTGKKPPSTLSNWSTPVPDERGASPLAADANTLLERFHPKADIGLLP
jgi:hypothetical protein